MTNQIDLWKLARFLLKYCWAIILCAAIGFGGMAGYTQMTAVDTYTASSTLYVYNNNPNLVNYGYSNASDLSAAVQLINTYMVVIRSNKVMDAVVDRLCGQYPNITGSYIAGTLSMGSVSNTGVVKISCTTRDPQMSADICNGVVDFAPPEIIRVVGAGSIEVIDYADVPRGPNGHGVMQKGMMGGAAGAAAMAGILVLLFLLNTKVRDAAELKANISTGPDGKEKNAARILAEIPRKPGPDQARSDILVTKSSPFYILESYNKLRLNINYAMIDKHHVVAVSSAVPGEGKSTIAANLAVTVARENKRVLLIDGDMRRGRQIAIFNKEPDPDRKGLSNLLIGECRAEEAIIPAVASNLDLLLVGEVPPNPAELLGSSAMGKLLAQLEESYDLIVIDTPPINVVTTDAVVLAKHNVSMLYVVRQNYSDYREIRKAMAAIEQSGMNMLGLVLYGERVGLAEQGGHYGRYGRYGKYGRYSKYGYNEGYDRSDKDKRKDESKWVLRSEDK